MKSKLLYFNLLALAVCLCFSSCATLFCKKQTITIDSNAQDAQVWVGKKYMGTTPLTFQTKTAKATFTLQKEGYQTCEIIPDLQFRANTLWNLFNGIGFIVDACTGRLVKYGKTDYYIPLNSYNETPSSLSVQSTLPNIEPQKPKEKYLTSYIANQIPISESLEIYSPKDLYNKYNSAVFLIYTSDGASIAQGSGFFVSSNGIAVSNYHVFKDTYKGLETIKLTNGKTYNITEVLAYNDFLDYIVFKVNGEGQSFNYIPITKRGYSIGDEVIVIGSPRGLENTLSNGLISQKRENLMIQISVPIDHGSSGGALINEHGEVIGITSGGRDDSGANLNFARDIRGIFLGIQSPY